MKYQPGHILYEIDMCVSLVEAIIDRNGFMAGGEQYPNKECALVSGRSLAKSLSEYPEGFSETALSHTAELSRLLILCWQYPLMQGGIVSISKLEQAVAAVITSMPQNWSQTSPQTPMAPG